MENSIYTQILRKCTDCYFAIVIIGKLEKSMENRIIGVHYLRRKFSTNFRMTLIKFSLFKVENAATSGCTFSPAFPPNANFPQLFLSTVVNFHQFFANFYWFFLKLLTNFLEFSKFLKFFDFLFLLFSKSLTFLKKFLENQNAGAKLERTDKFIHKLNAFRLNFLK